MTFEVRQEEDRIPARRVTVIGVSSVVLFFGSLGVAALLLGVFSSGRAADAFGGGPAPKAAPSTIGTVEQTLATAAQRGIDVKDRDRDALSSWGWVDRDAGVARIPIDRAIDVFVSREAGRSGGVP